MNSDKLNQATVNLLDWLNTWRQADGAYNGWVVHRFDLKRLNNIHDTPWEQTPIIDGLLNLYKITGNETYYDWARDSVKLQISRMDTQTGMFDYAGFEDDRFSSLVHNALADCALLSFAENSKAEDADLKQSALSTVKLNLDKYFMGVLYVEQAEAFKFNFIDFYWPDQDRFVANMNSVAMEALLRYAELSDEVYYREIAMKVLKSVVDLFCNQKGTVAYGGIGYANTHPEWYISIYTALALRGLCEAYKYKQDEQLKNILITAAEHLINYTQDNYFCHAIHNSVQTPYPYWIAGGGMILKGINDVERVLGVSFDVDAKVERILSHQLKCGGVSSFLKYNTKDNHRRRDCPDTRVWEEIAPGPPWNAHLFEYLTRFAMNDIENCKPDNHTSVSIKLRYIYFENKKRFFIASVFPLFSCALVLINKKKSKSIIGFSLRHTYSKIIKKIRKIK